MAVGFKAENRRDVVFLGVRSFSGREKWKKMERKGNPPKTWVSYPSSLKSQKRVSHILTKLKRH